MTASEHVLILLSLVISLALAHILSNLARLIQSENVTWSWLHGVWVFFVVLLLIDFWISVWQLRLEGDWNILMVFFWMTMAILNYLLSALVVPDQVLEDGMNLGDFHDVNRKRFMSVFLAILLFAFGANLMLEGFSSANYIVGLMVVCVSLVGFTRQKALQWAGTIGTGLLWIVYFSVFMSNF